MGAVTCRDIFNGIYINVRATYIDSLYSTKTKSTNYYKNVIDNENLLMTETTDPIGETNVNYKEIDTSVSESVTEKIDRQAESAVAAKIRVDLEEKVPYAIASLCSNLSTLDKAYRKWKGYEDQPTFSEYALQTSEVFPLSERFIYPCIMFVSSMVLMDINEKMSDEFYDKYASLVSMIVEEIPCEYSSTVEKYPY